MLKMKMQIFPFLGCFYFENIQTLYKKKGMKYNYSILLHTKLDKLNYILSIKNYFNYQKDRKY